MSTRSLLLATLSLLACGRGALHPPGVGTPPPGEPADLHLYVGSHSQGTIAHLSLDPSNGGLTAHEGTKTSDAPRALAWNARAGMLYAANDRPGRITTFRSVGGGGLSRVADVPSSLPGVWPVSLALHPGGRWLLVGHYENDESGPLSVVGLDPAGTPTGAAFIAREGCDDTGTFRVTFDWAGRFAFAVCDDDGVNGYAFDDKTGALTRLPYPNELNHADVTAALFAGGPAAYLYDGLATNVMVLGYDRATATFTLPRWEVVSFAVPGEPLPYPRQRFMPNPTLTASLTSDATGTRLFGANTYQNALAVMHLGADGRITNTTVARSTGDELRRPVHAVATRDGRWLLAANEETGTVSSFSLAADGRLTHAFTAAAVAGASFIALAE